MVSREHKRATLLHEKLQLLRSITNSHAENDTSIIVDASKYIQELKEKVERLNQDIIGCSQSSINQETIPFIYGRNFSKGEAFVRIQTISSIEYSGQKSDVDFSDVFGGPPRRSATQEFTRTERITIDFHSFEGDESGPWLDKPVFWEVAEAQRRYTNDDFFDDILRGDHMSSSSQSPRALPRRSPFASAPGSRVISPSPSLSLVEPSAGPVKFNLPGCLTNTDFTASTSMNQISFSPSLSRFNQTTHNHDDATHSSSWSSSPSRQEFGDVKKPTKDTYLDSDAKGSEFPIYATDFHFSIYKWASKGVPLVILSSKTNKKSREKTKLDRCLSSSDKRAGPGVTVTDALSYKQNLRPSLPAKEHEHFDDLFVPSTTAEPESMEDGIPPAEFNSTFDINSSNGDMCSSGLQDALEAHDLGSKSYRSAVNKLDDPPKLHHKEKRSTMRPLGSFLNDNSEVSSNKSVVAEKGKPSPVDDVPRHKFDKKTARKSSATKKIADTHEGTSKVKDFVKIFNQESPSKSSGPGVIQSHSKRQKDTKTVKVDCEIRVSSVRMKDDVEASYVNWEDAWPDVSEMDGENSSKKFQFDVNDTGGETPKNALNANSTRDSAPIVNAAADDEVLDKETTKSYEAKVSQWSKGKEGNIRALLSTMQNVLWPDSGWKTVPLVDIIEANAVKRAYQKALLRLHPDKLQQKGAALHHKFIAEKVFDILQEAWDQFNSLGSV